MCNINVKIEILKKHIQSYPNFPKQDILFWDIFSVLRQPNIFEILKDILIQTASEIQPPIDCVVALDARGFLFGPLIALALKIPFVPIRKKGKLPGKVKSFAYSLEYGQDTLEIQDDSIQKGQIVLIVDDLLATGGSLSAACELVKQVDGEVAACLVIMELEDLKGRNNVPAKIISLVKY